MPLTKSLWRVAIGLKINLTNREMTPEEETLEKIKYVLSFGNDPQAIRLIEQYGHWKQEQTEQCAINGVVKSLPLIEGKTKSNIKNNIPKEKLASPPPPIKR